MSSYVWQYLDDQDAAAVRAALESAATLATTEAPLAHLLFEREPPAVSGSPQHTATAARDSPTRPVAAGVFGGSAVRRAVIRLGPVGAGQPGLAKTTLGFAPVRESSQYAIVISIRYSP